MTNREWLFSLTDKELAEYLCSREFQSLKWSYTDSILGLIDWFSEEHVIQNKEQNNGN